MNNSVKERALSPSERQAMFAFFSQKAALPESEFDEFSKQVSVRDFSKGDFFTRIGDQDKKIGLVFKGGFLAYYVSSNGDMLVRNFCIEGTPIGSYATILTGQAAHINIEAFENSTAAIVGYEHLENFFDRHPAWDRLARKIAEQHYISRERREHQLLALNAEQRYLEFLTDFPGLDRRVTQANVAAYIGVTPVSLSRIKNKKPRSK